MSNLLVNNCSQHHLVGFLFVKHIQPESVIGISVHSKHNHTYLPKTNIKLRYYKLYKSFHLVPSLQHWEILFVSDQNPLVCFLFYGFNLPLFTSSCNRPESELRISCKKPWNGGDSDSHGSLVFPVIKVLYKYENTNNISKAKWDRNMEWLMQELCQFLWWPWWYFFPMNLQHDLSKTTGKVIMSRVEWPIQGRPTWSELSRKNHPWSSLTVFSQDQGPCEIETEPMSGGSELNKYSNQMLFCPMVRHLWRFLQLQEFQHSLMSGHSSLTQDSPVNTIDSHLIVYLGSPVEPLFQNISCAQSYSPRSTYFSSYGSIYTTILAWQNHSRL